MRTSATLEPLSPHLFLPFHHSPSFFAKKHLKLQKTLSFAESTKIKNGKLKKKSLQRSKLMLFLFYKVLQHCLSMLTSFHPPGSVWISGFWGPQYQHLLFEFPSGRAAAPPSIQPVWARGCFEGQSVKRCPRDEGEGVGLLLQALSPWPVMAAPLCTRHYAPALRQMERSRIQLQENKQVGSAQLRRSIVSITVQTELWCNWNDIWKTCFAFQ